MQSVYDIEKLNDLSVNNDFFRPFTNNYDRLDLCLIFTVKPGIVYQRTVAYTGQVTFYKVTVYLVG